ncbi:MAG: hypothetical protein IKH11_07830 [Bacteroidales bacterium]|nr:hypothetical protein [Bacteroidales bacterium]
MKASLFRTALLTLAAVSMLTSCDLFNKKEDIFVGISASSPSFVDGKANIKVSLSGASSNPVSVSLGSEGNIPENALNVNYSAEVPAGSTSADIPVKVDVDKLPAGNYEITFSINSVTGGKVDPSKNSCSFSLSVQEVKADPSIVSISNYSESFTDGKASFTLALDKASDTDVTVNFTVQPEVDGYIAIPAAALSFDNPAVIPAGTLTKEVNVTLDLSAVQKGVSNFAVIVISSVSDNARIASSKTKTYIEANVELTANLRSDWSLAFAGEVQKEGNAYHGISVSGTGENSPYYIFAYQKGLVDGYFQGDMTTYVKTMEQIVAEALGTADAYQIKQGEKTWLYSLFPVGEYEIWLLGCTESGHITGDYATATFKIEATAEQLEAYGKWLGEWDVTRRDLTDKWVISENVPGASFFIQGIDGSNQLIADILVEADYDAANDQVVIYTQECKEWTNEGVKYMISLIGMYQNSTQLVSGDFDLAVIKKTGENTASITSGGQVTLSSGTFDVSGMTFFAAPVDGSASGYVFNSQVFYLWPETMTRVVANDNDEVYNSFLGDWTIKRMDSEWDETAQDFKETGEVNDVWTIAPKMAGRTFTISGIEGYSDIEIVADYDAASATFSVKEQYVKVGEFNIGFLGLFYYPGDAQNQAGTYIWDSGATVFTAKKEGDTLNLVPGQASSFGDFTMVQAFEIDNQGYYNLHADGYVLPNTLTKSTGAKAPKIAVKSNGKADVTKLSRKDVKVRRMSAPATGVYRKGDKLERNLPLR